jgi:hypothetical protein
LERARRKQQTDAEEVKRKASEVESKDSEEEPLAKKFKSNSVIEDNKEEWEEWEGVQDKGDWPKDLGEERETEEVREVTEEVREVTEEVWEVTEEVWEVTEEVREMDKREVKKARKEARRSERSEEIKDLIHAVRDLGNKVDRFAEEVRVLNVLRYRADREYLEERRRWYFSDRMLDAKDWEKGLGEDSERYSV